MSDSESLSEIASEFCETSQSEDGYVQPVVSLALPKIRITLPSAPPPPKIRIKLGSLMNLAKPVEPPKKKRRSSAPPKIKKAKEVDYSNPISIADAEVDLPIHLKSPSGLPIVLREVNVQDDLRRIISNLKKKDEYSFFSDPVDSKVFPTYYLTIKYPMYLTKMEQKLRNGEYRTIGSFRRDIDLICDNAIEFNPGKNLYSTKANHIRFFAKKYLDTVERKLKRWEQDSELIRRWEAVRKREMERLGIKPEIPAEPPKPVVPPQLGEDESKSADSETNVPEVEAVEAPEASESVKEEETPIASDKQHPMGLTRMIGDRLMRPGRIKWLWAPAYTHASDLMDNDTSSLFRVDETTASLMQSLGLPVSHMSQHAKMENLLAYQGADMSFLKKYVCNDDDDVQNISDNVFESLVALQRVDFNSDDEDAISSSIQGDLKKLRELIGR